MVDYGTTGLFPTSEIYKLNENFVNTPVQSVSCYLRSLNNNLKQLSTPQRDDFLEYIRKQNVLFCKLCYFDQKVI